jgi:hypothetical protein
MPSIRPNAICTQRREREKKPHNAHSDMALPNTTPQNKPRIGGASRLGGKGYILHSLRLLPMSEERSSLILQLESFLLQLLVHRLQRLVRQHGSDGCRYRTDHVGAHAVVKGSPAFLMQYGGAGSQYTTIARDVDHAVRRSCTWTPC